MRIYDRLDKVILRAIKADGKMSADNSTIRGKVTNVVNQLLRKRWTGLEIRKPVTSLYSYIYNTVMREMHKQLKSKPVKTTTADEPTTGELVITGLNPTIGTLKHNGKKVTVIHLQDVVFGQTYEYTRTRNIYVVTPAKTGIGRNKTDEDSNLEAYVSRVAGYVRTAYSVGDTQSTLLFQEEDVKFVPEHEPTFQLDKDTWGIILDVEGKTYWIESDISMVQLDLENCYKMDFTDFITPHLDWEEPYTYDMREYYDLREEIWEEQDILLGAESLFTQTFQLRGERRKRALLKVLPVEHLRLMLWVTSYHYENLYDLDYNGYAGYFSDLAIVDLVILNTLNNTYKVYEADREPWLSERTISNTVVGYTDIQKDVLTEEILVLSTNSKTKEVTFTVELTTFIGEKRTLKDPPDEEHPYNFEPYYHTFTKEYTLPNLGYELARVKIDQDLNLIKTEIIAEDSPSIITNSLGVATRGIYTFYAFSQQEVTGKFFMFKLSRLYNVRPTTSDNPSTSSRLLTGGAFEYIDLSSNELITSGFCNGQSYSKAYTYGLFALGCRMPQATYGDNVHVNLATYVYWAMNVNQEEFELYLSRSTGSAGYGETNGGIMHHFGLSELLCNSLYKSETLYELQTWLGKQIIAKDNNAATQQRFFYVFNSEKGYVIISTTHCNVLTINKLGSAIIHAPLFHFSHLAYLSTLFISLTANIGLSYWNMYLKSVYTDFPYGWEKTTYIATLPGWNIAQLDDRSVLLQAVAYYLSCDRTPDGMTNVVESNSLITAYLTYTDRNADPKFFADATLGVIQHQSITSPSPRQLQGYLFKFRE